MGVDLAVYRARIGTFVTVPVKDVLSNTEYMFKAVNSVRYALTHDKLDRKGAVAFIGMLLRIQGIEPNPGPRERDQQLHTEEQADENNDIARTVDISISRVGDEKINTFVDNVLSRAIPSITGYNASNENDGTVVIPGTSSDVAAYSKAATSNPQINVIIVNSKHEETNVGTMNVKHTDYLCSGSQTIIHQGNKEDSDIPKKKRKKMDSTKRKLKRNASQAIKTNGDGVPKQKKKKEAVMNDPKRRTLEEHLLSELQQPCDDNSLSNAMDNTGNYRNYDRLRMVRLVLESRSWSVELLMKAMDKSLRLGYTDVVFFLHDHGATFSDQSLEYAIMDKPVGYDTYPLVMYLLERRKFSKDHINTALQMCLEMGHFKLMKMLLENEAELADKSLQSVIHKNWKPSDRHPALKLVLKTRQWDTAEKNAALFNAVKLGDIKVIKNLMECGGVVSRECLTEVLQRKCKPSHRLSLVRLLVTGSLSQDLLIDAREMARVLSEPKVESYIQQFIV